MPLKKLGSDRHVSIPIHTFPYLQKKLKGGSHMPKSPLLASPSFPKNKIQRGKFVPNSLLPHPNVFKSIWEEVSMCLLPRPLKQF
jgi:hypothetical protein